MKTPPPPPSRQKPTWISAHAIERYQQRIENVDVAEAARRMRAIVEPLRGYPEGTYSIHSTKFGPPVAVKLIINEQFGVTTVYPVTDAQITRAMKTSGWVPRKSQEHNVTHVTHG